MSEQAVVDTTPAANGLSRRVLSRAFWRYYWSFQISWNYERMQALGFCWAMIPALRAVHRDDAKFTEGMQRHLSFFNTNPVIGGPLILGASIAMEESGATASAENIKVAMMGPLAGIGDNLAFAVYNSIIFTLAATWAQQGNVIGPIFMALMVLVPYFLVRRWQFTFGYRQGRNLAKQLATGALSRISEGLVILGLIVLGGFIPQVVKLFTTITYSVPAVKGVQGSKPKTINVQSQLDLVLPYLMPVALTVLIYFLIKKFRLNPIWAIVIVLVLGILLGGLGYWITGHSWFDKVAPTS